MFIMSVHNFRKIEKYNLPKTRTNRFFILEYVSQKELNTIKYGKLKKFTEKHGNLCGGERSKVNLNGVCNYYDFIRPGLSLTIWFDIVAFGENIHMTVKIFASVDVFGSKARMDTLKRI